MTTTTTLVTLLIAYHSLQAIGNLLLFGPLQYDPTYLLLRGEPSTLQDGIEQVLPKILGMYSAALAVGLIFGLATSVAMGTTVSIRIVCLVTIIFHCGLASELSFDTDVSLAVSEDVLQRLILMQAFLGMTAVLAFVSSRRQKLKLTKPTPSTVLNNMARAILLLIGAGHAMIAAGMISKVGPAAWDPELLLVRGEPATSAIGVETAFPKILGVAYYGFAAAALCASLFAFSSAAAQTAVVPIMTYHFGALHDHVFGNANIVNTAKMDVTENVVGHGFFGVLCMIVFFLISAAISNNAPKRKPKRPAYNLKKYQ